MRSRRSASGSVVWRVSASVSSASTAITDARSWRSRSGVPRSMVSSSDRCSSVRVSTTASSAMRPRSFDCRSRSSRRRSWVGVISVPDGCGSKARPSGPGRAHKIAPQGESVNKLQAAAALPITSEAPRVRCRKARRQARATPFRPGSGRAGSPPGFSRYGIAGKGFAGWPGPRDRHPGRAASHGRTPTARPGRILTQRQPSRSNVRWRAMAQARLPSFP